MSGGGSPLRVPYAKYVALPRWDGQQWQVRVEDYDYQHRGDTSAGRLEEVGRNARVLLALQFGCSPDHVEVSVEPALAEDVEQALRVAEGYVAEAARHVDAAVTALRQANMWGHDIALVLAERALQAAPERPLLIPNSEIAAYGLNRRRDVVAVEWPDQQAEWPDRQAVLTCCRHCVESNPQPWESLPDGTSAAVYEPHGHCDTCGRDLAVPAPPTQQAARPAPPSPPASTQDGHMNPEEQP